MSENTDPQCFARDEIGEQLRVYYGKASPDEAVNALANELCRLWVVPLDAVAPDGAREIMIPGLRVVIREDDLKILDSLFNGLAAVGAAGYFLSHVAPETLTTSTVGLAAVALKLLYSAKSKGVHLIPLDYAIVAQLAAHPSGQTAAALQAALSPNIVTPSQDQIEARLKALTKAPSRSGPVALVWERDGVWRAADV